MFQDYIILTEAQKTAKKFRDIDPKNILAFGWPSGSLETLHHIWKDVRKIKSRFPDHLFYLPQTLDAIT